MLVLLDLGDDLGHLAAFGEVDQVRVVQKVGVALFQEEDVALVLPKEGHASASKVHNVLDRIPTGSLSLCTECVNRSVSRFGRQFCGCSSCNFLLAWLHSSCSMAHRPAELPIKLLTKRWK